MSLTVAAFGLGDLPAEAAPPGVYVVKEGDSLGRIADKLDVRLADLLTANELTVSSLILPGQELVVPGSEPGADDVGGTYTVEAGDSLSAIASRHQVKLGPLLKANGLTITSLITPGMTLTLPAGAVAAPPAAAPADPAGAGTYTVQAGDSLSRIASRHQVKLGALLKANGLTVTSLITPGMTLTLPSGAVATPAPAATPPAPSNAAAGVSYTVKAGDSLGAIASRHGVSLSALLRVNGLTATSLILPGMTLSLPAGASHSGIAASPPESTGSAVDTVIAFALAQQGKPYKFATSGPETFDCSGLTRRAYAEIGVSLVHQSAAQATQGTAVAFWEQPIRPGDLVFMATRGNDVISHVGLAITESTWIQARRPGDVVRVGPMPSKGSIVAVRRFVP